MLLCWMHKAKLWAVQKVLGHEKVWRSWKKEEMFAEIVCST